MTHLRRPLNIASDALVLEIGGGGSPDPRSSVLLERFLDDSGRAQRGGTDLVVDGRVLIHADGAAMPFADGQFDYVIASHVLEHIPEGSIDAFVGEMQRVASAGYVETPSPLYEAIRDIPEHMWYVQMSDGVIHVCPKTSVSRWQPFLDPLFEDPDFLVAVEKHSQLFFTGIEWHGSLELVRHRSLQDLLGQVPEGWAVDVVAQNLDPHMSSRLLERHGRRGAKRLAADWTPPIIWRALRRAKRQRGGSGASSVGVRRRADWRDIVVCPACLDRLDMSAEPRLTCGGCGTEYKVLPGDIPSLIASPRHSGRATGGMGRERR